MKSMVSSNWWHAPLFFTISVVLAFIAISTALQSPSRDAPSPSSTNPINPQLSLNASLALRRSGFNIMASLFQISPEIFLLSSNSTIFAIKDSALINASLPSWFLKPLLQYHTSPLFFSADDLLKKPLGSCIPSIVPQKNLSLTKIYSEENLAEINHVLVSHPDIFLEGNIAIHGVLEPFSSMGSQDFNQIWDSIQAPTCDANSSLVLGADDPKNMVEWRRIVHLLSSDGFVSFAVGLNSVLSGILEDYRNLISVTIFSPPELEFIASSSPTLDKIVRLHILPQRFTYIELASLPDKTLLTTLLPNQELEITTNFNVTLGLAINGMDIVAPEIFSSNNFIIHGISQAFKVAELPSISR